MGVEFIVFIMKVESDSTEMHSERARGNADKLKQEKFQLAITTKLFTMRVMQHWKRLPRSGYLHPEDTKNLPRQDIEQPDLSLKLVLS